MTRAIFLDRDGTINTEAGYLNHPDQVQLIPRAGAAIKLLNKAGFIVIVITFTLSAYQMGYDRGETSGLKRGFENGQRFGQP